MNSLLPRLAASVLAWATTTGIAACPESFDRFFSVFHRSKAFQLENTAFPISYSNVDHCPMHPDCPIVVYKVSREQLSGTLNPIFPLPAQRTELDLVYKVVKKTSAKATVALDRNDSDSYSFTYEFKRVAGCWRLSGVADRSL